MQSGNSIVPPPGSGALWTGIPSKEVRQDSDLEITVKELKAWSVTRSDSSEPFSEDLILNQ